MDVLPLGLVGDGALRAAAVADREVTRMEGVRLDHLAQYLGEVARDWEQPVAPGRGAEVAIRLGGVGTPEVPEFAVVEVAAALGLTQPAATSLCADVLDLTYRLRRLAGAVRAGVLGFARARVIARRTRELGVEQAALVQERLCQPRDTSVGEAPLVAVVAMSRLRAVVDQAVITVRGPESQAEAEQRVAASLFVQVSPAEPGAADVAARLEATDAVRLDRRLDQVAGWLSQVGDSRPKPILRAVALGLLAEPALLRALDDLRKQHPQTGPTETARSRTDQPTPSPRARALDPPPPVEDNQPDEPDALPEATLLDEPLGSSSASSASALAGVAGCPPGLLEKFAGLTSTVLYLHLDQASGSWCEERAGVLTTAQARALVGHGRVSVRPVLDLGEPLSYTGYVAPPRLKEQLALLNAGYCPFPYCHRRARAGDVDHQVPYANEGPTSTPNTHRPCRKHHRAKDKGGWKVTTPTPGVWIWTSPAGAVYLVSNGTTTQLNGISARTNTTPATSKNLSKGDRTDASEGGRTTDGDRGGQDRVAPPSVPDRSADTRTGTKDWAPSWDPWDDIDPLTHDEHDLTYGFINTA